MTGFDAGTGSTDNHECIPKSSVDDAINSNMKIVRFPIQPEYILKDIPNSSTYNDNLFLQSWYNTSGKQCINDGRTVWFNTTEDQPSYIDIMQYAIDSGLYVILDAHQDVNHLCAFGPEMTGDNFVNMWSLIATYIIKNVKNHEQVIFELYNEPTSDSCQVKYPPEWNNNYVIPAIRAIKKIESANGSKPHIILATTWGNWSGIHAWNDTVDTEFTSYDPDNPDYITLPNLISDLKKAHFTDTKSSSIVIAGHQYCDRYFSGSNNNCDPSVFNSTSYTKWLEDTKTNLGGFMWFLSEGNVQCDPTTSCTNSNLYIDFLNKISKDPKCLGFTVWYSGISDYGNMNMSKNYNIYSTVYPVNPVNGKNYDFSKFNTR